MKKLPAAKVNEATVLTYLSSHLIINPEILEKGKVDPKMIRMGLYGLLNSLWAAYDLSLVSTSRWYLSCMFILLP